MGRGWDALLENLDEFGHIVIPAAIILVVAGLVVFGVFSPWILVYVICGFLLAFFPVTRRILIAGVVLGAVTIFSADEILPVTKKLVGDSAGMWLHAELDALGYLPVISSVFLLLTALYYCVFALFKAPKNSKASST